VGKTEVVVGQEKMVWTVRSRDECDEIGKEDAGATGAVSNMSLVVRKHMG
jgi:hypothetical protein